MHIKNMRRKNMRHCRDKCHKWKVVRLCADDPLCLECDEKNEEGLKLIAIEKAAAAAAVAAGSRHSRAVESGAG